MSQGNKSMKVLITGASGFVGSQLIKHWMGHPEYQIRALVRKTSSVNEIQGANVEICYGDVTDAKSLQEAIKGIEAVVHLVSLVGEAGKREDFFRVNVEGTRNLLEACHGIPLKRFVHVSSLSVITGYRDHDGTGEDAPYLPTGENYADSKIEAEKLVLEYHQKYKIPVTILRPGFIYGPGDRLFLPTIVQNLREGKVKLIDHGEKLLNLIYIDNLIEVIELALTKDTAVGEIFNITDGEKVSKKQFFYKIADLMNLPRPTKSVPYPIARAICETTTALYKFFGIKKPPPISRVRLRFAGQNQWFNIRKAEATLGYKHKIVFDKGIEEAIKLLGK
jgi:nucleoside-diphosphate-sugar epimerase